MPLASFSAYRPSAVVYLNGDRDIAYADVFSNQIVLIRDVNGSREARVLASEADRIQTPIALRGIEGALIVANAGTATLVRCDLLTGATSTLATLPVVPGRLQSLCFPGLLLLNEPGAGPLYLYSTEDSSLLFVPRPAGPVRGHRPTPSLRRSK